MTIDIRQFACLSDNYGFLVRDRETGACAAVDTPDADAIVRELDAAGWTLTHILNTHHHWDHAGGNEALKARFGATVVGPAGETIPGRDVAVSGGETVRLGASAARVIATPGHTAGHVAYHFAKARVVFVGDTLFALGCGRLFEGTPAEMWSSLSALAGMPPDTRVYCAHEYTRANARFALTVDPHNPRLAERAAEIDALRERGAPTVPTTIGLELATNPFLRAGDKGVRAAVGMKEASDVEVFAEVRARKDRF